jgi:iron complex outermembrane receptor protein
MKNRSQLPILAAVLLAGAGPAFAVDEILVTAQRREEALQDVPLAVSAFDVAAMETRQIDVVKDIGQNVPNLQTYTVTAGAQAMQVFSRGTAIQNPGFNLSESPVGIYIDDVYYGRLASANLDLTDIERIEVLRGPQGTLYGRNTIAGAIKIVSRTPDDDGWLDASAGAGNYDTWKLTASAGGPLQEGALAGSLALLYEDRGEGWQDNPLTGAEPGQYENLVMRGKLHWYPGEQFDAVLTVWGADLENDGYNAVPYVPFANSTPNGSFEPTPPNSVPLGGFYSNFNEPGVNYGESDQAGANLTLSWELGALTLKSITGYASIDDDFGFDLAGGGFGGVPDTVGLLITSTSEFDQLSEELQLLGTAFDERLYYLLGLFYLNEDGSQLFSGDLGFPAFAETLDSETDSYAVFADGSFALTDRLSLSAGVRWTKDEKEYSDDCVGGFCFDDTDVTNPTPNTGFVALEDDWDETTLRVGVDYQLSDDQLLYGSFAQGYQSGGFRTLCFGNLTADQPIPDAPPGQPDVAPGCGGSPFDPQTVDSLEAGLKADLFDDRLRFNVAAFWAMYDDLQQVILNSTGVGFPINNIGEVDVYGIELETQWSPTDRINVYLNAGFQESDFGDVDPGSPPGGLQPPAGVDPDDVCPDRPDPASRRCAGPVDELSSNPQFQGKIGFDYAIPVSDTLEFSYGADVFYSDDYFSEPRNLVPVDSYTRVNAFLGLAATDERWQVVLTGRNITDEDDNVSGIFAQGFANIRTLLPPAEYMLTFKVHY